eukprot:576033-Rhodomonas_salina.1
MPPRRSARLGGKVKRRRVVANDSDSDKLLQLAECAIDQEDDEDIPPELQNSNDDEDVPPRLECSSSESDNEDDDDQFDEDTQSPPTITIPMTEGSASLLAFQQTLRNSLPPA